MKPKPFASLNHFTIPVAIERSLGRLEPPITIIRTSGRSGECLCAPKVARPTVDGGHFFELFRQRRTSPAELVAQETGQLLGHLSRRSGAGGVVGKGRVLTRWATRWACFFWRGRCASITSSPPGGHDEPDTQRLSPPGR